MSSFSSHAWCYKKEDIGGRSEYKSIAYLEVVVSGIVSEMKTRWERAHRLQYHVMVQRRIHKSLLVHQCCSALALWWSEQAEAIRKGKAYHTGMWPESPSFSDTEMPAPLAKWKGICQSAPNFNSSNCNNKLISARAFSSGTGNPNSQDIEGAYACAAPAHALNITMPKPFFILMWLSLCWSKFWPMRAWI